MKRVRKTTAFSVAAGLCLAAGASAPGVVLAEEDVMVEEVIVTGSRLKRDTFTSPTPIEVLLTEDARQIGVNSVTELLQRSTAASGQQFDGTVNNNSGNSNATEAPTPGGPGSSNIGLRALGPERTLILVNGRRLGSAGVRGAPAQPDINLMPFNLIESIDVVTEGASSIYGADAVAGVVNVNLRDEFEGFELTLNADVPEESGGEARQASFITGASSDRARFVLAGDYFKRERLSLRDRQGCIVSSPVTESGETLTRCRNAFPDNLAAPLDFIIDGDPTTASFNAWYVPGVSAAESDLGVENFVSSFSLPVPTGVNQADEGIDAGERFPFIPFYSDADERLNSDLVTPIERYSVVALGGFSPDWFGGNEEIYFEATYMNRQVFNRAATEQIFPGVPMDIFQEDANGNIVVDGTGEPIKVDDPRNPFNSSDWATAPALVVTLEDVPQTRDVELDQFRFVGGFRGDFTAEWLEDNNWSYDLYASYDRGKGFQQQPVLSQTNLLLSLQTARFNADGEIVCGLDVNDDTFGFFSTAPARDDCVPVNLFAPNIFTGGPNGDGQLSDEEREWLVFSRLNRTVVEQRLFAGYATGDLFDLWNDQPVQVAIGAEFRQDEIDSDTEILGTSGAIATESKLTETPTRGQRDLTEFYAEFRAPLVVDVPGINLLEFEGAARYTDESNFGDETTVRARVIYQPVDWVSLSGSFGTSFRAPNLREQFLGDQFGGAGATADPCTVPSAASVGGVYNPALDNRSATVIENCVASGADPTQLGLSVGTTIPVRVGGNVDDLKAETSESITGTLQLSPNIGENWELDVALSYWDIVVEDTVRSIGAATIADRCFNSVGLSSPFCARLPRASGPNAPPAAVNFFSEIDASFVNVGEETSVGYDLSTRLSTNVDLFGGTRITWQQTLTRQLDAGEQVFAEDVGIERVGDFGLPRYRYNTSLRASTGPWELVVFGRYIGATSASQDARLNADGDCDNFSTALSVPGAPQTILSCDADEAWFWDASLTFQFDETLVVSGGVNNLADEEPAYISQGAGSNRGGRITASGYDQFGRSYFLSLTKSF